MFQIPDFYRPEHFPLYELVPAYLYEQYEGRHEVLWQQLDQRMLWTAEQLRGLYGPLVACDWYYGGKNHYRGYRPPESAKGAKLSQHRAGRALDLMPINTKAAAVRKDIMANPFVEPFKYITCIERGVRWLHFDVRPYDKSKHGLLIVWP